MFEKFFLPISCCDKKTGVENEPLSNSCCVSSPKAGFLEAINRLIII